jgi:short-subunit dehydrogenase
MTLRVVITGASSGIGEALAREYARRGAILGLIARRSDALHALQKQLPCTSSIYAVDVRDANAMVSAAREFMSSYGGADVVIANAGVSAGTRTEHAEDHCVFQEILDTNLMGMVNTFAPFIPRMRSSATGTLVGMASVAGFRGLPGSAAYCASKAGAIAYLESLRVELRSSGLAVVTISPGYIATSMTRNNPYHMPFLLAADRAARHMVRSIERRKRHVVIPWQMALVGAVLKVLPGPLYDVLFEKAPRKPLRNA